MKINYKLYNNSGVALLYTLFIIGFFLSIVLTLSTIFIPKLRLSALTKNSVAALYSAESATEWCLYTNRINNPVLSPPVMSNGATYTNSRGAALTSSNCQISPIKIIGNYRGVTRSYEVSF